MQHPLTGTWIANIDQSQRDPNHQFHRATMRFELVGDRVSLFYGGINASGRQEEGARSFHVDDQEHAVPEAPGVVAINTLEPCALHSIGKKDGMVIGRATYQVSEDGQILTATVSGIDASGKVFDQVIVFDREQSAA
jgi:hypothetical protein